MDRYEEALERAKQGKPIEEVFPEIGEERTQELLHSCVCRAINDPNLSYDTRNEISRKVIPYLEKQKEQKPTAEEILTRAGLKLFREGNQWSILAGDNIQEGVCGFGDTIEDALYEFLKDVFRLQKEQKPLSPEDKVKHPLYTEGFEDGKEVGRQFENAFGEQNKSAEWSEEDKENAAYIGAALEAYYKLRKERNNTSGQMELDRAKEWLYNRFKFLRPQPKQEWSEKDKTMRMKVLKYLSTRCNVFEYEEVEEWLNNIRPQTHWKPSEEQMEWLEIAVEQSSDKLGIHGIILSLYEQLKRL